MGFIGKDLRSGLISRHRSKVFALIDTDIGKEIFPISRRSSGKGSLNIRLSESTTTKSVKGSVDSEQFSSKIKNFSNDRDFVLFLKSTAQKRISLTQSDKQQIVDELLKRIPLMSVHSTCDTLWSLGTLKMQFRQTVSAKD